VIRAPRRAAAALAVCVSVLALAPAAGSAAQWRVNPPGTSAYELSLAVGGGRLGVAWQGGAGDASQIWFLVTDRSGRRDSPPRLVSREGDSEASAANEPDLQALSGGWAVAWYEKDRSRGTLQAWLAGLDAQGSVRWRHALSAGGRNGRSPLVRRSGVQLLAVWLEDGADDAVDVMLQRFDLQGEPRAPAQRIGAASRETWNLNAAVGGDGTLYVVYDAQRATRAKELQLLRVTERGASTQQRLTDDDGFESSYPDIALRGERAALSWCDWRDGHAAIRLRVVAVADLAKASSSSGRERRVTDTPEDATAAYLAWRGGTLALAWNQSDGTLADVWLQSFDRDLRPLREARRLTAHQGQSWIPALRAWRSGLALAWDELQIGRAHV
jgi:hypothetical protein